MSPTTSANEHRQQLQAYGTPLVEYHGHGTVRWKNGTSKDLAFEAGGLAGEDAMRFVAAISCGLSSPSTPQPALVSSPNHNAAASPRDRYLRAKRVGNSSAAIT
jgi:hypothetical protein